MDGEKEGSVSKALKPATALANEAKRKIRLQQQQSLKRENWV